MKFLYSILITFMMIISTSSFARTVTLSANNTLVLRGVVEEALMAKLAFQQLELDSKLEKGEPIYPVISSPGGYIDPGEAFIRWAQTFDREIKPVVMFAASMAFVTAESFGERLIVEDGILMSHRACGGIEGQFNGEVETRLRMIKKLLDNSESKIAKRVGMSLLSYRDTIQNEWWMVGDEAIEQKAADEVVTVECDSSLKGVHVERVQVFIFSIPVMFSNCPLNPFGVIAPRKDTPEDKKRNEFPELYTKAERYINMMFNNQPEFVKEFIITNKYLEFKK